MGQALYNQPNLIDKRLFLTSDTQARVTVSGPSPTETAINVQLKEFETFTRTNESVMYTDSTTGLLRFPDINVPRFEVNGIIVEPTPLFQYCRRSEFFNDLAVWTQLNSIVISSQTQVDPTGTGASADVLSDNGVTANPAVSQILAGLDPISTDYRFSVWLKPLPPAPVPNVELLVNFTGSTPDPAITLTLVAGVDIDVNGGWQRFDLNAFNANAAHNAVEVRITLTSAPSGQDIAVWGANFTESDYLASYRPRDLEALAVTGEESLVYNIDAMGIEPTLSQDFTVFWEFLPLGEQGRQAPQIALADGASSTGPIPPNLYDRVIAFGAHPSVATDFKLAITDTTSGSAVVYTHAGTYNWSRYSHQKWAFVVFNDGSQKCRFFANGTFLGETTISPNLTADSFTKFTLPQAAIHRRIETLAEKLSNEAAISATTIL
jgi:hypothetical protein